MSFAVSLDSSSVDSGTVNVLIGGSFSHQMRLADYRFEGYANPLGYLNENGQILSLRSFWCERLGDIAEALAWFRSNRSKHSRIFRSKAKRFRRGEHWDPPKRAASYFRNVSMNAHIWLDQLKEAGVALAGSFINVGANDGISDDPLHHFAMSPAVREGGPTLAIEGDPELCAKHRANLPWVTLACDRVYTRNFGELLSRSFRTKESREQLDALKIDIDSFDGAILQEALERQGLRPKVILIEVNSGIPPPLKYALLDSPQLTRSRRLVQLGGVFQDPLVVNMAISGASLSWLVNTLAPDYSLLEFGSPDAVFVRTDLLPAMGRTRALDEFRAYSENWLDTHGFSRHLVRRWLWELDEVDMLAEAYDHLTAWAKKNFGEVPPFMLSF